jgi:hypothetical protein
MNTHPVQALDPVFEFLDRIIRDQGDILFMVFAYVALAAIAWILSGGLRRRQARRESGAGISIIVIRPPAVPPPLPPPIIGNERDSFTDDDGDSFAA